MCVCVCVCVTMVDIIAAANYKLYKKIQKVYTGIISISCGNHTTALHAYVWRPPYLESLMKQQVKNKFCMCILYK